MDSKGGASWAIRIALPRLSLPNAQEGGYSEATVGTHVADSSDAGLPCKPAPQPAGPGGRLSRAEAKPGQLLAPARYRVGCCASDQDSANALQRKACTSC